MSSPLVPISEMDIKGDLIRTRHSWPRPQSQL